MAADVEGRPVDPLSFHLVQDRVAMDPEDVFAVCSKYVSGTRPAYWQFPVMQSSKIGRTEISSITSNIEPVFSSRKSLDFGIIVHFVVI